MNFKLSAFILHDTQTNNTVSNISFNKMKSVEKEIFWQSLFKFINGIILFKCITFSVFGVTYTFNYFKEYEKI